MQYGSSGEYEMGGGGEFGIRPRASSLLCTTIKNRRPSLFRTPHRRPSFFQPALPRPVGVVRSREGVPPPPPPRPERKGKKEGRRGDERERRSPANTAQEEEEATRRESADFALARATRPIDDSITLPTTPPAPLPRIIIIIIINSHLSLSSPPLSATPFRPHASIEK